MNNIPLFKASKTRTPHLRTHQRQSNVSRVEVPCIRLLFRFEEEEGFDRLIETISSVRLEMLAVFLPPPHPIRRLCSRPTRASLGSSAGVISSRHDMQSRISPIRDRPCITCSAGPMVQPIRGAGRLLTKFMHRSYGHQSRSTSLFAHNSHDRMQRRKK